MGDKEGWQIRRYVKVNKSKEFFKPASCKKWNEDQRALENSNTRENSIRVLVKSSMRMERLYQPLFIKDLNPKSMDANFSIE